MRIRLRSLAFAMALFAGIGPVSRALAACQMQRVLEFPVVMRGLRATVTAKINGQPATFMVDSGAFFSVINTASAKRFGLRSALIGKIEGVNGSADEGVTTVKTFEIAGVQVPNLQFVVTPGVEGSLDGVLGQNFLGLGDVEYDLANGAVRMFKAVGCTGHGLGKGLACGCRRQLGVLPASIL